MPLARTAYVGLVAVGLGCDGFPNPPPTTPPSRSAARSVHWQEPAPTAIPHPGMPKPDASQLRYDPTSRTLTVVDPPAPGVRWMLGTPTEPRGIPIAQFYQFPPTMDLEKVTVFLTTTSGRVSTPVTLGEVIEAHEVR